MKNEILPGGASPFVLIGFDAVRAMSEALARRDLQPADGAVLLALINRVNVRTGKAEVTSAELAEALSVNPSFARNSLARLKKVGLVAFMREGTTAFYAINPALMRCGSSKAQAIQFARWEKRA
jgi:DNA-binding transcriptional ArsR family regulator